MKKNKKNDERTLFWYSPQSFDLLLTLSLPATPIGVFPDYFGCSKFLATSCCFCKKKLNSLNCPINFTLNKPNFCRLSVLVCCRAVKHYSEMPAFFQKFEKTVRTLG